MNPFATDGHLHDLGLELHLAGALGEQAPAVDQHLVGCLVCRARARAAQGVTAPVFRFAPPPPVPVPVPANRSIGRWVALFASAAVVGLTLSPWVGGDGLRVKGSPLRLEVFREVDGRAERLRDGDPVSTGDHLGFRVRSARDGHLLVAGTDGGAPYLCYPQEGSGRSAPIVSSDASVDLNDAVRMDAAPGEERIVAILCDEPFELDELPAPLGASLPEGYVADTLRFSKVVW